MANRIEQFIDVLDDRVADTAAACTACGACAAVCPTLPVAGIVDVDSAELTRGVRAILRGSDEIPEASRTWATKCCSSGACLDVCPHGINPRFMLTMARRAMNEDAAVETRRAAGKSAFQKMSRGVRLLSRLTMSRAQLARLNPGSRTASIPKPDVVFYTGCNMLKTPHIGLLCLEVLDALAVAYDVQGGPGACCGILQARPGDTESAARQAFATLDKFSATGASHIVSWCPTCQIQFGETMMPGYAAVTGVQSTIEMFPVYLASRLDDLRPLFTHPVRKRVAIYEYAGQLGVMEAVRALLAALPGLEIVEIPTSSIGYNNSSLVPLGSYHRDNMAAAMADAEVAGVDTFVGIYHADHRELSGHEASRPFRVANYMELIGEAMGIAIEDRFKQLKLLQDADAVVAAAMPNVEAHGLDVDEVRDFVVSELLAE